MAKRHGGQHQGHRHRGRPKTHKTTTPARAPYNFVPLSRWVYQPDWADAAGQDIPFRDGISGCFEIELEAETPLLVGGAQKKASAREPGEVRFFRLPDGKNTPAIPGSALRGMVRSVLEVASFGKMRFVDDVKYSVRDLSPGGEFYKKAIVKVEPRAGWLRFDPGDGRWRIRQCEFARVRHDDLMDYRERKSGRRPDLKRRQDAADKYAKWGDTSREEISFDIEVHRMGGANYDRAVLKSDGEYKGKLVLTGQPSDGGRGGAKFLEFIFYDDAEKEFTVSAQVMRDFQRVNSDDKRNPSGAWAYWMGKKRSEVLSGKRAVPIFFHAHNKGMLSADNPVKTFGLAYMYRLLYDCSIGDMIDHTSEDHRADTVRDLAGVMFGYIEGEEKGEEAAVRESLKGRVTFDVAVPVKDQNPDKEEPPDTILNGPKPTFYPNYVKQSNVRSDKDEQGRLHTVGSYVTYMDPGNDGRNEIRGWKRYPVRAKAKVQKLNNDNENNTKVQVKLRPLKNGARFKTKVRVHNLRRVELGALLWALTFGENRGPLRHALGMGKPFGFGRMRVIVGDSFGEELKPNERGGVVPGVEELIAEFVEHMNAAYRDAQDPENGQAWDESEQVFQLRRMADPVRAKDAPGGSLEHPVLEKGTNEFSEIKNSNSFLPEYARYEGMREEKLGGDFRRLGKNQRNLAKQRKQEQEKTKREALEQQAREEAERARRETLDPVSRWIAERLDDGESGAHEDTVLLKALDGPQAEELPDDDARLRVALHIKKLLEDRGNWRPETKKKNPDKDKDYVKTKRVLELIKKYSPGAGA